jgi:excinuclease ABC subunit C
MPATALRLSLPTADLESLRDRVRRLAEPRPGVYRMLDPLGRVLYVGKAKRVKQRLLSYFRAKYPEDKAARILHAAADITWDYTPSEFAAHLTELRQITRFRPPFNWHLNRARRTLFIKMLGGAAPRLGTGGATGREDQRWYGPFVSAGRVQEAVRTLNDLLGLRDCAPAMPMVFAGQMDLFTPALRAACMRHEFGFCTGPCAGLVTEQEYRRRAETAIAFLEGRTIQPVDRIVREMQQAAESAEFERAARWRERFEQLEWLLAATSRARAAVAGLTFVYRDPGAFGDDRAYLVRHGVVRASYPWPSTPIEQEAFRGVVREELDRPAPAPGPLPYQHLDEILLLMAWFRRHPEAFRRTSRLEDWVA